MRTRYRIIVKFRYSNGESGGILDSTVNSQKAVSIQMEANHRWLAKKGHTIESVEIKPEACFIFEQAIARQEALVIETACKFDDETQEEFDAKIAKRIAMVCVGIGHANEIPGINDICPGMEATWHGFKISRRRVDHLDNIYVRRDENG